MKEEGRFSLVGWLLGRTESQGNNWIRFKHGKILSLKSRMQETRLHKRQRINKKKFPFFRIN